ncbi:MAG: hypothetical protein JWO67_3087 [Streptosporangiaceae bacterium]|nr:hypothetical protein [Streptosporangiaceae bacterium]
MIPGGNMNRSIRTALRASLLASVAAGVGLTAAPMRGFTGTEPAAYPLQTAAGKAAWARHAQGDPQRAVTRLGKGASKDTGLRVSTSGLLAKCASAAGGAVSVPARAVVGDRFGGVARSTSMLPVQPPADYHVPVHDPNAVVMVSKQVNDPFGGMTVSGAALDTSPGTPAAVRDAGVAQCDSVRRGGTTQSASMRQVGAITPQAGPGGDVVAPVTLLGSSVSGLPRSSGAGPAGLLRGLSHPARAARHHGG